MIKINTDLMSIFLNDDGERMSFEVEDRQLIDKLITLINKARREGVLAVETILPKMEFEDPMVTLGVQLVADGTDPDLVETILVNTTMSETFHPRVFRRRFVTITGIQCMQCGINPKLANTMMLSWYGGEVFDRDNYKEKRRGMEELTFDKLVDFPQPAMVRILTQLQIGSPHCWRMSMFIKALHGASQEIKNKFWDAMTERLKERVKSRIERDCKDITTSDYHDAQAEFMHCVHGMISDETILDPRDVKKYTNDKEQLVDVLFE